MFDRQPHPDEPIKIRPENWSVIIFNGYKYLMTPNSNTHHKQVLTGTLEECMNRARIKDQYAIWHEQNKK